MVENTLNIGKISEGFVLDQIKQEKAWISKTAPLIHTMTY